MAEANQYHGAVNTGWPPSFVLNTWYRMLILLFG
uniref:Uncharacterized protein n=1 Tax=Providencia stuartii (strain MRSN 2154) TaxID=1157951 RepID=A0A140NE72_PROSM|nr:hypothetical protein pMR0211_0011 [Providencia stuartii]